MANKEHLEILKQGVETWNKWRLENHKIRPDLSGADFGDMNLSFALLVNVDLSGARLHGLLSHANLSFANLSSANLGFELLGPDTNFRQANLSGALLTSTNLSAANFSGANLKGADFGHAIAAGTVFADVDLSEVKGLQSVGHVSPSEISISTIYRSKGRIPEVFLRGCGVPDEVIALARSLVETGMGNKINSCFISYSHRDEKFAYLLSSRMRDANLLVWYAPEEMKGGQKLHEQIFSAIQFYDKLLLVLSENSLQSEWVATEIRRARKVEREENRRKLFPIRLVDFDTILKWECFDAGSDKDLAIEVREYFIPDFSNWKDRDAFESAFDRLLRDLNAEDSRQSLT